MLQKIYKKVEGEQSIELYFLNYRNANVANLNYTPAQLLPKRNLRTKLPIAIENIIPILNYNAHTKMLENQIKQKQNYDKNALKKEIVFNTGDKVFIQDYKNKTWEKGEVMGRLNSPSAIHIRKRRALLYEEVIGANKKLPETKQPEVTKPKKVNKKSPATKKNVVTMSGRVIRQPNRLGITNPNVK